MAGMRNRQAINVKPRALQVASIFCPADVLEVSRSGGTCHMKFSNTRRSGLLDEFCRGVTSAFLPPSHSQRSHCRCAITDFPRGHGSGSFISAVSSRWGGRVSGGPGRAPFRPILTDTVCDLQRQAEQMLIMRSPWAPGLRRTFKATFLATHTGVHKHTDTHTGF